MDIFFGNEDVIKVLFAILVGGLIGAEREFHDKAAGFRTIILICTGATLFTIFSGKIGGPEDPVRIAANVVSGVGFLGAGAIMRDEGSVKGLTTAATVWLAAALGMGIGGGFYELVGILAGILLVVMWIFPSVERRIDNIRDAVDYTIIIPCENDKYKDLVTMFKESGLNVHSSKQEKSETEMICTFHVAGTPKKHDAFVEKLFNNPDVKSFSM